MAQFITARKYASAALMCSAESYHSEENAHEMPRILPGTGAAVP